MKNPWEKIYREGKFDMEPHLEIETVAEELTQNNSRRILDLGCGTGRQLIYLASKGLDLYGLDSSPTGLMIMLKELYKRNLSAHIALHDMTELPYENNFFDAVISVQVIHHNKVKDIKKTIKEICRILRDDGIIWITVPAVKNEPSTRQTEIEPGTFVPLDGEEEGLIHHYFKKSELLLLLGNFKIIDFHIDRSNHFSILARKVSG